MTRPVRPGAALRADRLPTDLEDLRAVIESCRACPRLTRYRERLAREGLARTGVPHWGRPVAGFGDPGALLAVVGLAPAAQGANRTGRVFTGDRSATFLMAALHRAGFASHPDSVSRDDGLCLRGAYITAAVRCVPPGNHPSPAEARRCRPYLVAELRGLPRLRAVLALGGFAWDNVRRAAGDAYGVAVPRRPFHHGERVPLGPGAPVLWAGYHPSPRNTQTGLLSAGMFDSLLARIRVDLEIPSGRGA